jgi:predicted dehydrogenase
MTLRLAMLGMVEGNGHPYSWSAIINGRYNRALMEQCGYPAIPKYLAAQPPDALGIDNSRVTHVWCEDAERARHVANACYIDHVAARATDVIGHVDAAVIATDIGAEHLERAKPFVEAGLPVFVDKPLTTNAEHLRQFVTWRREGRKILSTSAMRYAREFDDLRPRLTEIAPVRLITVTTPKSWARYGVHALEAVYPLAEPGGWVSAANTGVEGAEIVHLRHAGDSEIVIAAIKDLVGCFGCVSVYGAGGMVNARFADTFGAFKSQLIAFVDFVRTGREPFDFAQTVEQMKIIIAGERSRRSNGRTVLLSEIEA